MGSASSRSALLQLAVKRYRERNPMPNPESAKAGIIERKRVTIGNHRQRLRPTRAPAAGAKL